MNIASKQQAYHFGVRAEQMAKWYLICKGYRVLAMRYRNGGGEIDIVAMKGNTLVPVEVKARKTLKDCEETVMNIKQEKIARAAEGLLAGHGKIAGLVREQTRNIRFDVIWIAPGCWPKHIKDAWRM
ncbi:MAG: YraN family protein [Rickettsiales bacterium]